MRTASENVKFIESVFGRAKVYTKNVDVNCPLCKDSTKKRLSIRLDDHVCHCWVCGFGARTLLPLLLKFGSQQEIQEYRTNFLPDVVDITKYKAAHSQEERDKIIAKLPSDFRLLVLNQKARDPDLKACRKYVEERGLLEREQWYWKLGVSNEPGLRRRVIMPSYDAEGVLNYYVARAIDKVPYMKYTNAEGDSRNIVFNELNIDWLQRLTIVEGPFDLMKCRGNATCLLGSNLSEKSALFTQLLIHQTPVVLMLDNDMGGKTQTLARFLNQYSIETLIADLKDSKDPGEMNFAEVTKAISNAKPWSWNTMLSYKLRAAMSCSLKLKKDDPNAHSTYR